MHVAVSDSGGPGDIPFCDRFFAVTFARSPFTFSNIQAYRQLKEILDSNDYDLIHCHTPVASVLTRLAARKARKRSKGDAPKVGAKVFYTAHGFHFFKGASLMNWKVYYPIEKWLSRYTDCLITINQEDYDCASKNFRAGKVALVHGVGVDVGRFKPQSNAKKAELRNEYGYENQDFILIYAGELNHNKHQDFLIEVASMLKDRISNLKILLAGNGQLLEQYQAQIRRLNVEQQVVLLGYRNDIHRLLSLADIAVSSSRREGLPVNVMEAMAVGLPLIVTDCRGNRDLVVHNRNGFVVASEDKEGFAQSIEKLYHSEELRKQFSVNNLSDIQQYRLETITDEMEKLYLGALNALSE